MGIVGKLLGGTIGFALGGPLGAIAGAVFGHAFDSSTRDLQEDQIPHFSGLEASQLAFFVGAFSMLAKLTQSDGRVSPEEMDTIEAFAVRDLRLSPEAKSVALNIFRTALESPASFNDFALQFYNHFQGQPHLIEMMVDILLRVSVADGALNATEESLILGAVRIFRMSEQRYQQVRAAYAGTGDVPYQVLGCRPDDSDDMIKQRYRKLVQEYHPDKIASKGLPDEFIQLAHEKFREIQNAYETIKKERTIR
ncbi:co-chaperone DjlA [Desulfatitalea tepidiphila]|uniref:co-chaperone DjlA n=1 Tax=Desulfatitalea tepidiphila TaxID=1185843 RepID=UPI0006B6950C|nr:co-chaperone DjlA [Desulfatitalea tepidiphila]